MIENLEKLGLRFIVLLFSFTITQYNSIGQAGFALVITRPFTCSFCQPVILF
jgi:hypothetical protein